MFLLRGRWPYVYIVWRRTIWSKTICSKTIWSKTIWSKTICSRTICWMFALHSFPPSLPRTGQDRNREGAGKKQQAREEVGKELVGATGEAQTSECSNKLYWT